MRAEPMGSARATFDDWPSMATSTLFWRVVAVGVFALILAGVVQLVRYQLLKRAHRDHTFSAVHHDASTHHKG